MVYRSKQISDREVEKLLKEIANKIEEEQLTTQVSLE